MTGPRWLGPPERPLFGWLHTPPGGTARGAVLVCPPLGRQYLQGHYALRLLAEALARAGFCALRLDYAGTGNSAGDGDDPDAVAAWLESVRVGLHYLGRGGDVAVSVVGVGMGALLGTTVAAGDGGVDQLVLWDPCSSGRAFLREDWALGSLLTGGRMAGPVRPDGSVETPGVVYPAATVAALGGLDLATLGRPWARRVLTLVRPDRIPHPVFAHTTVGSERAEVGEATGQAALMDRGSPLQEPPTAAIARIVAWLGEGTAGAAVPVGLGPGPETATVLRTSTGVAVTETVVAVPPAGLFGVLTAAPEHPEGSEGAPTAILLSVANQPGIGPNRLWVELARRWAAAAGVRTLRLDLSGLGDSPHRDPAHPVWVPHKPAAYDDVADAVRWAAPGGPRGVVLVGLCSSAYQALESALALGPRAVAAVNPGLTFVPPERAGGGPTDPRRRIAFPKDAVPGAFRQGGRLGGLRRRLPRLAWWARILADRRRRSGVWMADLAAGGTRMLVVCGDEESRPIRYGISPWRRWRLTRRGMLRFTCLPDLHHELVLAHQRGPVADIVTEFVLAQCHPDGADGPGRPGPDAAAPEGRVPAAVLSGRGAGA
ncbi:MAG TPA: alpha/beta hydrolase family protein [Acidimicrobiales bacterium]|nr:alpha/beta hydrolase family protein [Acidimicrobiales bacterium]